MAHVVRVASAPLHPNRELLDPSLTELLSAKDEQAEKRIKIRPCFLEISRAKGLPLITSKTETLNSSYFFGFLFLSKLVEKTIYSLTLRFGTVVPWTCILKNDEVIYLILLGS